VAVLEQTKSPSPHTMGRRKNGKPPGCESAFSGEKLEWLLTFEEDFRFMECGAFYDEVMKKFLTRYGYD
jgi:hypothetical protein